MKINMCTFYRVQTLKELRIEFDRIDDLRQLLSIFPCTISKRNKMIH